MVDKINDNVTLNGGDYRVAHWAGRAAPILAVHGITSSHMAWPSMIRELHGDYDVYAPDLRGRGDSAALPPPYGFAQHVEDLLCVLDHYALQSVIYVGHSLGAYIGLDLALAAPSRLRGLVLVDGGIALPPRAGATPQETVKRILGPTLKRLDEVYPDRESYYQFWQSHPSFQDYGAWTDDVRAFVDYDLGGFAPELRSRVNREAVAVDALGPLDPGMVDRIDQIKVPTLLLTASRGLLNQPQPLLPIEAVAAKAEANDNLHWVEITDTNHYSIIMGRGARQVAAEIDSFIADLS